MKVLFTAVLLVPGLSVPIAQAQRAPDPAPLPRHELAESADLTKSSPHPRAVPDEAHLQSHRYISSDGRDVHAPSKSKNGRVPVRAMRSAGMGRIASVSTGAERVLIMAELPAGSNPYPHNRRSR